MNIVPDYVSLPDAEAEAAIFSRIRKIDESLKLGYAAVGLLCQEVEKRGLWRLREDPATKQPCTSFTRWVRVCADYSYSTCFAALTDVRELSDIPAKDLAEIPQSNFETMRQLSTGVRSDPDVLKAAKTKKGEDFVESLRQSHPGQHLEHRKTMKFRPAESGARVIEQAIEEAMKRGASTRDEGLEMIAANALEDWNEESKLEDAYLHAL